MPRRNLLQACLRVPEGFRHYYEEGLMTTPAYGTTLVAYCQCPIGWFRALVLSLNGGEQLRNQLEKSLPIFSRVTSGDDISIASVCNF